MYVTYMLIRMNVVTLISLMFSEYERIDWVDQTRTDIIHYQKMVFFQIKLQLISQKQELNQY